MSAGKYLHVKHGDKSRKVIKIRKGKKLKPMSPDRMPPEMRIAFTMLEDAHFRLVMELGSIVEANGGAVDSSKPYVIQIRELVERLKRENNTYRGMISA